MAVLVVAEIAAGQLNLAATSRTVAAVKSLGDVVVLCAGADVGAAADAAARIEGVAKVLTASAAAL